MTHLSKYPASRFDVLRALNNWKRREFKYGDSDCCSFIAFIVNELIGVDHRENFTYNSEDEANQIIEDYGSFEALIDSVFGEPQEASDGCPVMLKLPIVGKVMGIKLDDTVVCVTKHGMSQISDRYIIRSWNIWHLSQH